METKTTEFKVGDIVRIAHPGSDSTPDMGKIGIITHILKRQAADLSAFSSWPITVSSALTLRFPFFSVSELELVPEEEAPLWRLRLPNLD